jgi:hypothetical protein
MNKDKNNQQKIPIWKKLSNLIVNNKKWVGPVIMSLVIGLLALIIILNSFNVTDANYAIVMPLLSVPIIFCAILASIGIKNKIKQKKYSKYKLHTDQQPQMQPPQQSYMQPQMQPPQQSYMQPQMQPQMQPPQQSYMQPPQQSYMQPQMQPQMQSYMQQSYLQPQMQPQSYMQQSYT